MSDSRYENLWNIIVGYFHEDFDLFGQDIFEIMKYHKSVSDEATRRLAIEEIEKFKSENQGNIDAAFRDEFGEQLDFRGWGYATTISFLDELKKLLQE